MTFRVQQGFSQTITNAETYLLSLRGYAATVASRVIYHTSAARTPCMLLFFSLADVTTDPYIRVQPQHIVALLVQSTAQTF